VVIPELYFSSMKNVTLLLTIIFSILIFSSCGSSGADTTTSWVSGGIGLGGLLAVLASWERNKSILWALIHFICGWLYVIYYIVTR